MENKIKQNTKLTATNNPQYGLAIITRNREGLGTSQRNYLYKLKLRIKPAARVENE